MLRLEAGVPHLRRRHPISTLQSSRKMGRIRESGAHGDGDHPEMIKSACLKHPRTRDRSRINDQRPEHLSECSKTAMQRSR